MVTISCNIILAISRIVASTTSTAQHILLVHLQKKEEDKKLRDQKARCSKPSTGLFVYYPVATFSSNITTNPCTELVMTTTNAHNFMLI